MQYIQQKVRKLLIPIRGHMKCRNGYNLSSQSPAAYSADAIVAHSNENTFWQKMPQLFHQICFSKLTRFHLENLILEEEIRLHKPAIILDHDYN